MSLKKLFKPILTTRINRVNTRSFNYVGPASNTGSTRDIEKQDSDARLHSDKLPLKAFTFLIFSGSALYFANERRKQLKAYRIEKAKAEKAASLNKRFDSYATVFDKKENRIYLTTHDLFRALLNIPKSELSDQKIEKFCPEIFTELFDRSKHERHDKIFSLTEYVLLTSILITPKTKLKIAFGMLDHDMSDQVSRSEFSNFKAIFRRKLDSQHVKIQENLSKLLPEGEHESIQAAENENKENIKETDHTEHTQNYELRAQKETTALNIKFFGLQGDQELTYTKFANFSKHFQNLVFQLEYKILDDKSPDITGVTREHFAAQILELSNLPDHIIQERISKLDKPKSQVSFEDYKAYRVLLNNLNIFKEIMKYFALADRPVKFSEMSRASKLATLGEEDVSEDIIDLLFSCYDSTPDDGTMDYVDFLGAFQDDVRYRYVYTADE